jgi:hypothetical protein
MLERLQLSSERSLSFQNIILYNVWHIKRGLTRPANLQLVQGGYPEREMWPKGNIERQPSTDNPLEGFIMSIELNRRDFIKIVFATASVTAVSGTSVLWPSNAISRPVFEPVYLSVEDGYIIDPYFDYCDVCLPTFREYHSLLGLRGKALKVELEQINWSFEHVVADPNNWTINEVEEWLDSQIEMDVLGAWEGMKYTQYGPALEVYEQLDRNDAEDLGLLLIEGCHPGSDFVGIEFHGDPAELTKGFERLGMNLVVT